MSCLFYIIADGMIMWDSQLVQDKLKTNLGSVGKKNRKKKKVVGTLSGDCMFLTQS